jgi:hypothetical protein
MEEEKQCQKQLRVKDLYDVLLIKVQAIRSKNLPAEKWTSSELNTMIQGHKQLDNAAMPSKKADKLARYYDICGCGDPVAPTVPMQLVPPTQLEQDDDADADVIMPLPLDVTELPPLPAPDHPDLASTSDAAVENFMVNGADEMLDVGEALLMFASANEAV